MKNHFVFIAAAVSSSMLAWVFWHYLGRDAFTVLPTIGMLVFGIDNYRLRKRLRAGVDGIAAVNSRATK